jgi:hypothetical protein
MTNLSPRQNDRLRAHMPLNAASLKKARNGGSVRVAPDEG